MNTRHAEPQLNVVSYEKPLQQHQNVRRHPSARGLTCRFLSVEDVETGQGPSAVLPGGCWCVHAAPQPHRRPRSAVRIPSPRRFLPPGGPGSKSALASFQRGVKMLRMARAEGFTGRRGARAAACRGPPGPDGELTQRLKAGLAAENTCWCQEDGGRSALAPQVTTAGASQSIRAALSSSAQTEVRRLFLSPRLLLFSCHS